MKREYVVTELGYFTESAMKKLKERMDGKSYMNFEVGWSNISGNCTLIIKTDYYDNSVDYETAKKEVIDLFMHIVCEGM